MGLRERLLAAAAERPETGGETRDMVEAAVLRIADLLDALPAPERRELAGEVEARLPVARASLRKLEKRVRHATLSLVSRERISDAIAAAPDIRIDDLRGTTRFSLGSHLDVRLDGEPYRVPVIARILGGELERALLTRPTQEFVELARQELASELDRARQEARRSAKQIEGILQDRVHRPLYNGRALRRLVKEAIREAVDLEDALERIRYDVGPLDREANERERVRAMVEEHGLIAYREYFPRARALHRELVFYAGRRTAARRGAR
jgi:hypothetical protein